MEFVIAVFVGIWIAAAGVIAYSRIKKDFSILDEKENDKKGDGQS